MVIDQDGVEVVGVARTGFRVGRQSDRKVTKCLVVLLPDLMPALPVAFDALQLMDTDGSLQVHHVVFEASRHDVVVFITLI